MYLSLNPYPLILPSYLVMVGDLCLPGYRLTYTVSPNGIKYDHKLATFVNSMGEKEPLYIPLARLSPPLPTTVVFHPPSTGLSKEGVMSILNFRLLRGPTVQYDGGYLPI